jgi:hypothetical protein
MRKLLPALSILWLAVCSLAVCPLAVCPLGAAWWNPCLPCGDFFSSFGPSACCSSPWPSPFNFEAGIGYRRDTFRWSRGRMQECRDIQLRQSQLLNPRYRGLWSELQWKDVRIIEFGGSASYVSCRNYAIKAWGSYGHIYHGVNKDSDFFRKREGQCGDSLSNDLLGNDPSIDSGDCDRLIDRDLVSRSINKAGRGHVYDASIGVGYRVTSSCKRFIATPLIGYSDHAQCLHIFDGNQVYSRFGLEPLGPFPGLNSRYTTRWFGPWAGMDFTTQVEKCAYAFGSFEWHQLHYRGHGCWNLRSDMGPFYHRAHGFGYLATLGAKWEIWNDWGIGVVGSYRNFRTRGGKEKVTLIDPVFGVTHTIERLNGVHWNSWSITGIISWRY